MSVFVLDANIVSHYLKRHEHVVNNMKKAILEKNALLVAPIAYYEVKRGLLAVNSRKRLDEFEKFCDFAGVGQLDNRILSIAADIYVAQRKKSKSMGDADVFIAAFCRLHNFILVTHNTKHFEHIEDLPLEDWTIAH